MLIYKYVGSIITNMQERTGASRFSNLSSTYDGFGSPPSYSSTTSSSSSHGMQRYESFENPLAGGTEDNYDDDSRGGRFSSSSGNNPQFGAALYDFTAGGDDEVHT